MKVNIPFKAEFRDRMLSGQKTCSSRTRRYGVAGDTFVVFGGEFEIVKVEPHILYFVAQKFHYREGFNNPQEFIDAWNKIHPRKGYDPEQLVWAHFFRRIDDK